MKQISTGTGLCVLGLGIAVLGTAQLIGSKGSQAFAQVGSERRIVNMGEFCDSSNHQGHAYRVWSDGVIENRCFGQFKVLNGGAFPAIYGWDTNYSQNTSWQVVENGLTPSVQPSDTNSDGTVNAADLGKVLGDYGATQETTPVTIDCQTSTIP